ncbi:MAG: hypothetical protein WBQ17_04605 [Rhizomicrobium sp.]
MKNLLKLACAALFVVASGAAQAGGDLSPADNKALHDYTLSMDKIRAMQAAQVELKQLVKSDPALSKLADDTDDSANLTQLEAKLNSMPKLAAVYRKHGLTAADAILMPLTLMGASVAVQYPSAAAKLAAQTSPAQIAFVKAHAAELKKMTWLSGDQN